MNPKANQTKARLPLFCKIVFAVTALSAALYVGFMNSTAFADFFNRTVSPVGRFLMAKLTSWVPFSTAEMLVILLPVALISLIVLGYRRFCDSWRRMWIYVAALFSAICIVLNLFVWNFAAGYYGKTLDEKLGLERTPVSADELYQTAEILSAHLRELEGEIVFLTGGASMMPYSYSEMNDLLLTAYQKACEKYDFIDDFSSRIKPVMLSEPMSYTHITGVYSFFTGEANLNVNFPDYTLPYTAAHELAHQRGIAREDEANFVAFLVCMESDDAYIRYSAYLNVYEYVISALYSANQELYKQNYQTLPRTIVAERQAYAVFFEKYRENVAASISQATNNAYLQSQGATAGTKSYNMVVDLAVAYYRSDFSPTP